MMKPTYEVRAWREHNWWLAQVLTANDNADETPLGALAHTRSLAMVEQAVRDLVATILDVDETAFDIEIEYLLPNDLEPIVFEAIGARTWLDAAQELWRESSTVAVRVLAAQGFSPRDTGKILCLTDQRVASLLNVDADSERRSA